MEFFPTKDENKINESSKNKTKMKKNILKTTLVATFALLAGYNVYNSQKAEGMSELALANVEALADGESSTRYQTMGYCSPLDLNYMCTSKRTAESCRRGCP